MFTSKLVLAIILDTKSPVLLYAPLPAINVEDVPPPANIPRIVLFARLPPISRSGSKPYTDNSTIPWAENSSNPSPADSFATFLPNALKASLKFSFFLPPKIAFSIAGPPTLFVTKLAITAVVPALIATSLAKADASASVMPDFNAVAYASSKAPSAVPPKASTASKLTAVPIETFAAIFFAYASPASNASFLATLPTPPLATNIGISCNISLPIISERNTVGLSANEPKIANVVSTNPVAPAILSSIAFLAAFHSGVF